MTLLRPSVDYTAKDFDALHARIINIIPSAFPEWTDTQISNFGNLLVELFAFVGDVLLFYQDNQAKESRWSTAMLRRSILSLLKIMPYRAHGASAATAQLMAQLSVVPTASVTFQAGDLFSTQDGMNSLQFRLLSDVTIPANANPPVAFLNVENSVLQQEYFTSTQLSDQSFVLTYTPYLDDSITVAADNGLYEVVDDFLASTGADRHAVLTVDENSRATLTFGNGVAGQIPSGTITLSYKTGGGATGNVAQNTIRVVNKTYSDANGVPVLVTVSNPAKAGGGDDIQTIESIRERAPRSIRALSRTVGREDYEINALRVPGVARALMLSKDEMPSIYENQGALYIVPSGGGFATQALLNDVYNMIHAVYPKTITFKVAILSATYLKVDISTVLHFQKGVNKAAVAARVRAGLVKWFALKADDGSDNNNIDFGFYLDGALAWSDVFNVIRDVSGVRKIDDGLANLVLNGKTEDVTVPLNMFPLLGNVVIADAETGASL